MENNINIGVRCHGLMLERADKKLVQGDRAGDGSKKSKYSAKVVRGRREGSGGGKGARGGGGYKTVWTHLLQTGHCQKSRQLPAKYRVEVEGLLAGGIY